MQQIGIEVFLITNYLMLLFHLQFMAAHSVILLTPLSLTGMDTVTEPIPRGGFHFPSFKLEVAKVFGNRYNGTQQLTMELE